MEKWLHERLSECLGFEVPDDMIKYVRTLKNSREFDDYFETLLNSECEVHRLFLTECKQRLFSKALPSKKGLQQPHQLQQEKKLQSYGSAQIKQNHGGKNSPQLIPKADSNILHPQQIQVVGGAKKKTKYVNLYANDGNVLDETVMLKGRRICECQASQHKLINNCITCGRIVCEQEGSGPCLFCGEIVCTADEMQVLKGTGKKGENLMKSLKEKGGGECLRKALEQRDRLLEYDRNSEKRTTVIDDELDYFQETSVWLSDAEREKFENLRREMHEQKHAGRSQRKIKVDFAGRHDNSDDEPQITEEYERSVLQQINATARNEDNWSNRKHSIKITPDICAVDPNLEAVRPVYHATAEGKASAGSIEKRTYLERTYNRVQDKGLLEMQDMRQCLSMHQPWASLLVAGIKKHEGRVWYSEHRGRLWIASTVNQPHPEEIQEVENFYRSFYNDPTIKFPESYPMGCLLGCVKVEECLPQEEYREVYTNIESDSPYVFICSNPEQLPVVFPIKGQHKIYQIDPKIHNAACKTLLRLKVAHG